MKRYRDITDPSLAKALAHPLRTQAIAAARVKTDAVNAKTLAHLLRTGLLPEVYIAPPPKRAPGTPAADG